MLGPPISTPSVLDGTSKQNGSAAPNAVETKQAQNVNISNTNQVLQTGSAQITQKSKETYTMCYLK